MTTIEERITEAITHTLRIHPWGPDLPYHFSEYVDRVMPDVVTAVMTNLGIAEERRTLTDGWVQPSRDAFYHAHRITPPPAVITHEHRYVTPWQVIA